MSLESVVHKLIDHVHGVSTQASDALHAEADVPDTPADLKKDTDTEEED